MHWGYYCRTCGVSTRAWFTSPDGAFTTYLATTSILRSLARDEDATLPTVNLGALRFLAHHPDHEIWAECESGVLRISGALRPPTAGGVPLPQRFRRHA